MEVRGKRDTIRGDATGDQSYRLQRHDDAENGTAKAATKRMGGRTRSRDGEASELSEVRIVNEVFKIPNNVISLNRIHLM